MIHASLNVIQTRLTESVIVVEGDAGRWDRRLSTNALITGDGMAMRRPVQLTPAWATTTGATDITYKRFGLADMEIEAGTTLAVAGGYIANDSSLAGDTFIERTSATPVRVYTATDWAVNQGFWLEVWVPPGKRNEETAIAFAWGEYGTVGTVGIKLYVGGEIEIFKWVSISGTPTETMVGRYDTGGNGRSTKLGNAAGQRISLLLVPCSRRDLYISTSGGTEIRHTFTDLAAEAVGTITPAGRAWWYIPSGKASVSLSELRFGVGTNNLYTEIDYLRAAPTGTYAWASTVYWDRPAAADTATLATAQVVLPDNPTTLYPSAAGPDSARILVQLTGGNLTTPFVYGAYSRLAPKTVNLVPTMTVISGNTTDGEIDTSDDSLLSFDMSVGEQPDGVSATLRIKDSADDVLWQQSGHSVRLLVSQLQNPTSFGHWRNLFVGVTKAPKRQESQRELAGGFRNIVVPCSDMWHLLDGAIFEEDGYPYDGWLLHQAVGDLLTLAGIPLTPRDIETSTLRLDYVRPTSDTKWAWKPQAGDSVGQWLKKIWETLAPTWYMGFYPTSTVTSLTGTSSMLGTWGFQFRGPGSMSTTAGATIYLASEGNPLDTYDLAEGHRIPCYSFTEETLPAEASRVTIWGYDPASRTLLRGAWKNTALENPITEVVDRPAGWIGMVAPYVATLPRLRTAASVAAVRDITAADLGTETKVAEWECPLLFRTSNSVVIWKGDVVQIRPAGTELDGGDPVGGRYRVRSWSMSWKRDALGRRLVSYVGERIGDVT